MAIDRITHGNEIAERPAGARQLGARVKPIIRLGMGHRHPEKGYPIKDDHFTIRGDERVIAKFKGVYGETPKAIKIMVPSSLALALDISYRSFVGGGDGDGRPLALGMTNFATLGYVGGRDVLRYWKQDGTYAEVETEGLDELGKPLDEIAADLKIEVHATLTATIPDVLGWGSFFQVTSKGKKSADNLAFKLTEIYSAFGSRAPWAFAKDEPPLLVIKPDTALMRMEKGGEAKWAKTNIFVLDIVIPEAFHDMQERLLEKQRELDGRGGAVAELYGPQDPLEAGGTGTDGDRQQAAVAATPPAAAAVPGEEAEEADWSAIDNADGAEPSDEAVAAAGAVTVPGGVHQGKPISELAGTPEGQQWMLTGLKRLVAEDPTRRAIETYVRASLPEVLAKYETWKAEQS